MFILYHFECFFSLFTVFLQVKVYFLCTCGKKAEKKSINIKISLAGGVGTFSTFHNFIFSCIFKGYLVKVNDGLLILLQYMKKGSQFIIKQFYL